MENLKSIKVNIKLVLVMFFWGMAFVSGRSLSQNYSPFCIAFLRFFQASIILIFFSYYKNNRFFHITFTQFLKVLILGLTGVFAYNFFFFNGLKLIEAGRASIIIATNPVFTSVAAILFLNEKLSKRKIFGILLGITGAMTVISK